MNINKEFETLVKLELPHLLRLKRLATQKLRKAIFNNSPKVNTLRSIVTVLNTIIYLKKIEKIGGKNG